MTGPPPSLRLCLCVRVYVGQRTSEWTLDYPPFFAWFEWALSQIAQSEAAAAAARPCLSPPPLRVLLSTVGLCIVRVVRFADPRMLEVGNLNYASEATVIFQRLSVIITDLVLFYAIHTFARARAPWLPFDHKHSRTTLLLLSFCNPGLLMVDHIHFQYNGFLLGLFIYSLACINQGRDLMGALTFAILLNLKHIFLYVAPVYFIYLLCHYGRHETEPSYEGWEQFNRTDRAKKYRVDYAHLVQLAAVVLLVFALSFGPFIVHGQLLTLKERLFPFRRGLSHAYWAPNVWAIYNSVDLVLAALLKRVGLLKAGGGPALTGGLVAEISHQVLPSVPPWLTFTLTFASMVPVLWRLSRWPHPSVFMSSLIYCSLCSFMLGWHVHEKAILITLLPLALLACDGVADSTMYLLLATAGHYSLFPLLHPANLTALKLLLLLLYTTLSYAVLYEYHYEQQHKRRIRFQGFFGRAETLYLALFAPLFVITTLVCPWIGGGRYAFLPLLLTSLYCALGMCYGWWLCYQSSAHRTVMLQSYEQEE